MLKDHEILDLGSLSLECISICSHSRDGMGFYDYDHEVLFSGDAVDGRGTVRDAFIIITDVPGFYESMELLNELDVKVLLPGHNYLPYQRAILRKALAKGLITHTLAINNEIKEMIIQLLKTYPRPLSASEMSTFIVSRLRPCYIIPSQGPNMTVLAHLDALIKENKVEPIEKDKSILFKLRH